MSGVIVKARLFLIYTFGSFVHMLGLGVGAHLCEVFPIKGFRWRRMLDYDVCLEMNI